MKPPGERICCSTCGRCTRQRLVAIQAGNRTSLQPFDYRRTRVAAARCKRNHLGARKKIAALIGGSAMEPPIDESPTQQTSIRSKPTLIGTRSSAPAVQYPAHHLRLPRS